MVLTIVTLGILGLLFGLLVPNRTADGAQNVLVERGNRDGIVVRDVRTHLTPHSLQITKAMFWPAEQGGLHHPALQVEGIGHADRSDRDKSVEEPRGPRLRPGWPPSPCTDLQTGWWAEKAKGRRPSC